MVLHIHKQILIYFKQSLAHQPASWLQPNPTVAFLNAIDLAPTSRHPEECQPLCSGDCPTQPICLKNSAILLVFLHTPATVDADSSCKGCFINIWSTTGPPPLLPIPWTDASSRKEADLPSSSDLPLIYTNPARSDPSRLGISLCSCGSSCACSGAAIQTTPTDLELEASLMMLW